MAVAKKPAPSEKTREGEAHEKEKEEKTPPSMCDNHPDTRAEHTTTSTLHQPISLCKACLRRVEYMRDR